MLKKFEEYIREGRMGRLVTADENEGRKEDLVGTGTNIKNLNAMDLGLSVLWADVNLVDYDDRDDITTNEKDCPFELGSGKHFFSYCDMCVTGKYNKELKKYGWRVPTYKECKELVEKYKDSCNFVLPQDKFMATYYLDKMEIGDVVFPADGHLFAKRGEFWASTYQKGSGYYLSNWMNTKDTNFYNKYWQTGFVIGRDKDTFGSGKYESYLRTCIKISTNSKLSVRLVKDK